MVSECEGAEGEYENPFINYIHFKLDPRDEEAKRNNPWTNVLKTIIKNCYKYHGREDLLHKFNNIESASSTNTSNLTSKLMVINHHNGTTTTSTTNNSNKRGAKKSNPTINNSNNVNGGNNQLQPSSRLLIKPVTEAIINNNNNNNQTTIITTTTGGDNNSTITQTYAVLQDIRNLEQLTALPSDLCELFTIK